MAKKTVKVKLVKSFYGRKPGHMETARGLGLRRINHIVEVEDTPATRGMINKVFYMVEVLEN